MGVVLQPILMEIPQQQKQLTNGLLLHSTLAAGASKWYFESKFTLTSSTEGYIGAASVPAINDVNEVQQIFI